MNTILSQALTPATQQVYRRAWSLLHAFGQISKQTIFPLCPGTLGLWISHIHQSGYATNTIRTFVSAVGYAHKIQGLSDPTSSFVVGKFFAGLAKVAPAADSRMPITKDMLESMVHTLSLLHLDNYDQLLYKTMFFVAFYGLCRVSEVTASSKSSHNLLSANVQAFGHPHKVSLTFSTYKHSVTSQAVIINPQEPAEMCPVISVRHYIAHKSQSTYFFCSQQGLPIPQYVFTQILKRVLIKLDLDPKIYTSHSFRIGGATLAARTGMSALDIQRLGRWRSYAFLQYLRW